MAPFTGGELRRRDRKYSAQDHWSPESRYGVMRMCSVVRVSTVNEVGPFTSRKRKARRPREGELRILGALNPKR